MGDSSKGLSFFGETVRIKDLYPKLGTDLPAYFHYGLTAIDPDLHIIYHKYRVLWDDIINIYEGPLDDTRFTINQSYDYLNFGFVLTDNKGAPIQENAYHIWRKCWPHGWAHVLKLEDHDGQYLNLVLNRLYLQAKFTDRYGFKAWSRRLNDDKEKENEIREKDQRNLTDAITRENDWLLKKAGENLLSGKVQPTNPQHEAIYSYPGQANKTKTIRPLTDEEGGILY